MYKLLLLFFISINSFASIDLKIQSLEEKTWNVFCGAVEIKKGVFATAAHCVNEFKKDEILAGGKSLEKIETHIHYKKSYKYDQLDFAIIEAKTMGKVAPLAEVKLGDIVNFKGNKLIVSEIFETEFKVKPLDIGACLNDSGSPAFFNGKLVGILSRGDIGCKKFAIFTKIGPIIDWYRNSEHIKKLAKKSRIKNLMYYIRIQKGLSHD